ncbi:MAG: DsbA family protein [Candidatus Dadabacteria bacterium]|nr:DsbA family protein [Candidatus Dadabacteria bacterium]
MKKEIFTRKMEKSITSVFALVFLTAFFLSSGSLFAFDIIDSGKLEQHFRGRYGVYLPPGFTVKAVKGKNSDVKGFKEGEYQIGFPEGENRNFPFLVSLDGKFLIMGSVATVKVDQMKETGVAGMREGTVLTEGGEVPILVSGDRETIIVGRLENLNEDPAAETAAKISLENVPLKGNSKALVTVVEYSDFQCGYCARAADQIADFLKDYKGKVRFFYKQFPLSFHKWAEQASVSSLCIYDQSNEKFWEFHDAIFKKQSEIKVAEAKKTLADMASKLGVDMKKYNECVESGQAKQRVASDIAEGRSIGVSGTPTFVVDGFVISAGANMKALKNAVDYRLSLSSGE